MKHNITLAKPHNPTVKQFGILPDAEVDTLADSILNLNGKPLDLSTAPLWKSVEEGQLVIGTVVDLRTDIILVDYGNKSEGFLPYKETDLINSDLDVGDQVKVVVTEITDEGKVNLSRELVTEVEKQQQVYSELGIGSRVDCTVTETGPAGYVVDIRGLTALLPRFQASSILNVGDKLLVQVTKRDSIDSVVVSRKAILEAERQQFKEKYVASLQVGDIVEGVVKSLADFGVFIDIGSGIIGLCHISDISFDRVEHPKDVLQIGQKVRIKILKIEKEKNRVTLGIKQTQHLTWDDFMSKHSVNDRVTGKVISILKYGAFIEIESGIQGLIHVSEMSWSDHVKHPGDSLKVGDSVDVVILGTDAKNRLALGLKQTQLDPWTLVESKYYPGYRVQAKVVHKTQHGYFMELEKGVDGFLSAKDARLLDNLKVDDELTVTVAKVDMHSKRITLIT